MTVGAAVGPPGGRGESVPAPLLVLGGVVSVQFGGALAATLIPTVGVGGAVLLRMAIGAVIMMVLVRPPLRGHTRAAWADVVAFALALSLMNWAFYGALARLPIGVAVTIEFTGPLVLATVLSRRLLDVVAVLGAGLGVVMISEAFTQPLADLDWLGLLLAALAGACWAAYILTSARVGRSFARLQGLALTMLVSTVLLTPVGAASWPTWTAPALLVALGVALLSSVLPYSLELMALRRLSARVFGVLLSLEPAVAALAGLLVLGQRLDGVQLAGMGFVVAASVLVLGAGRAAPPGDPGRLEAT